MVRDVTSPWCIWTQDVWSCWQSVQQKTQADWKCIPHLSDDLCILQLSQGRGWPIGMECSIQLGCLTAWSRSGLTYWLIMMMAISCRITACERLDSQPHSNQLILRTIIWPSSWGTERVVCARSDSAWRQSLTYCMIALQSRPSSVLYTEYCLTVLHAAHLMPT